ncbi:hypothetical protein ZIOFF_076066 [Zingiber officinale]|uniref:Uncharacterized protein n=1 Tax=Zingiber officinale TaxID=94328 RepID=A0A8J5BSW1_ZINOF|nr:hypothetical protein ZIOFF_076066 [Zingiber officinale]
MISGGYGYGSHKYRSPQRQGDSALPFRRGIANYGLPKRWKFTFTGFVWFSLLACDCIRSLLGLEYLRKDFLVSVKCLRRRDVPSFQALYRIDGIWEIWTVIIAQKREKAWFASSPKSQLQYLAPTPSFPTIAINDPGEEIELDPSEGPVDVFCLLIFDPDQVDYLNSRSNERLIFTSKPNGPSRKLWMSQQINP